MEIFKKMMITNKYNSTITKLIYFSGVINVIGLMVFNNFYSKAELIAVELPKVFSNQSQYLIQLWGLVYISIAKKWTELPLLCFILFLEKMLFAYFWYNYIKKKTNRQNIKDMIFKNNKLQPGLFLLFFGPNDFLFGLVFAYASLIGISLKKN
jgi:hypothetical protein